MPLHVMGMVVTQSDGSYVLPVIVSDFWEITTDNEYFSRNNQISTILRDVSTTGPNSGHDLRLYNTNSTVVGTLTEYGIVKPVGYVDFYLRNNDWSIISDCETSEVTDEYLVLAFGGTWYLGAWT
jgi:hypothetical protein